MSSRHHGPVSTALNAREGATEEEDGAPHNPSPDEQGSVKRGL